MENEIWIEKYRPKRFEDVIGQNLSHIKDHLKNLPHFLLVSKSPGTGKTSTAKIIIKELKADFISLNASDERGIDVIRNKIKTFAMTRSTNGKFKIVHLDEADYLTRDAQPALRNMMETYASNCRFILTANYENKLIEPLRSRCVRIEFSTPSKTQISVLLQTIVQKENLNVEMTLINQLIDKCYPDIRKMVNNLQRFSMTKNIKDLQIRETTDLSQLIFNEIKNKNFENCREIILNNNFDVDDILIELHDLIINSTLSSTVKFGIIVELAECMKYTNIVINKEILFEAFLIKSIQLIR